MGTLIDYLPKILFLVLLIAFAIFLFQIVTKESLIDILGRTVPGYDVGNEFDISKEDALGPLEYVDDYFDRYSGNAGPRQPSEVACEIANTISDDFISKGFSETRDIGNGKNCLGTKCLIDIKRFELEAGRNNPGGTGSLTEGCNFCQEGGTAIPLLDEICVNYNLKDRTLDDKYICSDEFADPIDGVLTEFGNNACFVPNANNIGNWDRHCDGGSNVGDDFCDGGDQGRDNIEWIYNKVLESGKEYIYGTVWYPTNLQYELHFEEIPVNRPEDKFDFIADVLSNTRKTDIIGHWYEEAREVYRATVVIQPTQSPFTMQKLRDLFSGTTITDDESCLSEQDCLSSKITEGRWCQGQGRVPVTIKIGGGITANGKLGHETLVRTYIVSVKNWFNIIAGTVEYPICVDKYDTTISIWCTNCIT